MDIMLVSPKTCPFGTCNYSDSLDEIQVKTDKINKENKNYY